MIVYETLKNVLMLTYYAGAGIIFLDILIQCFYTRIFPLKIILTDLTKGELSCYIAQGSFSFFIFTVDGICL